jgi:hypothetical protein
MLVLRPPSLMANWADVGFLDSFLERQIERYHRLTVPTIVLAGDRDLRALRVLGLCSFACAFAAALTEFGIFGRNRNDHAG